VICCSNCSVVRPVDRSRAVQLVLERLRTSGSVTGRESLHSFEVVLGLGLRPADPRVTQPVTHLGHECPGHVATSDLLLRVLGQRVHEHDPVIDVAIAEVTVAIVEIERVLAER
jgi:hypothetical protein